jgi:hypothetical protein
MLKIFFSAIVICSLAAAQDPSSMHHDMAGMHMEMTPAGDYLMNLASGTSLNPKSWAMPMHMVHRAGWQLMFMGEAFLVDTQQPGPRAADKFYSVNWGMLSAEHPLGKGSVMFQTMLSLEPATITNRRYPLLFQTGETAYGTPLVDAQHPHDFVMSLGVHYARPVGEHAIVSLYFAPVGDPALGPVAYPHRASAEELPQATLSHHLQDSTHIANEVLTAGIQYKKVRVEASGFYGTEPDESRWNIDYGPINSWSTRVSVFPSANWMGQFSIGRLTRPERQELGDSVRITSSLHYTRGGWSSSFIWGRNHKLLDHTSGDSFLGETVLLIGKMNFITGRVEVVDKDELFQNDHAIIGVLNPFPAPAFPISHAYRICAYTAGYTRDFKLLDNVQTGIGTNVTAYHVPDAIQVAYGRHPYAVNVFFRVRLQ